MSIACYLHSKGSFWGFWHVLCELPILWQSDVIDHPVFTNCPLYSSNAPWDYTLDYYFSLHTFALDRFFYHYDVSLNFYADGIVIPVFDFFDILFLCLSGIKSLMFQNHTQLKPRKTEFPVMSSLKLQRWSSPLLLGLYWPQILLQTGIKGVIFNW
jgi:hypothetical protein